MSFAISMRKQKLGKVKNWEFFELTAHSSTSFCHLIWLSVLSCTNKVVRLLIVSWLTYRLVWLLVTFYETTWCWSWQPESTLPSLSLRTYAVAAKWVRVPSGYGAFGEHIVTQVWKSFVGERTEHHFTLIGLLMMGNERTVWWSLFLRKVLEGK